MFLVFLPPSFSGNLPSPLLSPFYFIIYLLLPKVVSNNVASPTSYLINAIKHFLTKTFGRIWNLSLMKLGAQQLLSLLSPEIVSQQKDLLVLFQISMKTCTWIYSLISKGLSQEMKFKCRFRIKLRNVLFNRGHFTCRGSYLMTWGYSRWFIVSTISKQTPLFHFLCQTGGLLGRVSLCIVLFCEWKLCFGTVIY